MKVTSKVISLHRCKFYVYHHIAHGRVAYVGSGRGARAFNLEGRGFRWAIAIRGSRHVDVRIVSYHQTRAEALEAEISDIWRLQPTGNARYTRDGGCLLFPDMEESDAPPNMEAAKEVLEAYRAKGPAAKWVNEQL